MSDEMWAKLTTEWCPHNARRRCSKLIRRWQDLLDTYLKDYAQKALNRVAWKEDREAFTLKRDDHG